MAKVTRVKVGTPTSTHYEVNARGRKRFETDIQQLAEDVAKLLVKYHSDVLYYRASVMMVETTTDIERGEDAISSTSTRHVKRKLIAQYEAIDLED